MESYKPIGNSDYKNHSYRLTFYIKDTEATRDESMDYHDVFFDNQIDGIREYNRAVNFFTNNPEARSNIKIINLIQKLAGEEELNMGIPIQEWKNPNI